MRLKVRNSCTLLGCDKPRSRNGIFHFIANEIADFFFAFSAIKSAATHFLNIYWCAGTLSNGFPNGGTVNPIANTNDHEVNKVQMRMIVNCIIIALIDFDRPLIRVPLCLR